MPFVFIFIPCETLLDIVGGVRGFGGWRRGCGFRGFSGVFGEVSVEPPFDAKFHFHWKFCINMVNLGYRIYPTYSHPLLFTYTSIQLVNFDTYECL